MNSIIESWFIKDMIKATSDMWLKGWDERNGGNISLRLDDADIKPYEHEFNIDINEIELTEAVPTLAHHYILVTGSGKFFRNVQIDPAANLCVIKINAKGDGYQILWGMVNGGLPTSEIATHLQSHAVRKKVTNDTDRVIMHCHATNLIALTYVLELTAARFTHELWQMSTECLVVFPDGVGVVPWMVPGTDSIGNASALLIEKHSLVIWAFHGVFGAGPNLDDTFGLIDTAEKSAQILVKVIAMGGRKQGITIPEFRELAARFGVTPFEDALQIS
ncbi:rhamnulose-1-phosphate aldolase [Gammaproteobacteria bacterium]|nr:rhamnulose-1-phosphate aldolase [Gammaproteobacteria bacterium]